jgi:hypothetical protein
MALVRDSGWKSFPRRLPDQPIFYPVLNEFYATEIAQKWNTRDGETGYVMRFQVEAEFLAGYEVSDRRGIRAPGVLDSSGRSGRVQPPHRR